MTEVDTQFDAAALGVPAGSRGGFVVSPAVRGVLCGAYGGAFILVTWRSGLTFERPILLAWLMGAAIVATLGRPGGGVVPVLRDWLPYGLALTAYDFTRGAADQVGMPLQVRMPIEIDKFLFVGRVPNVEVQRWLGPFGNHVAWWEVPIALTYASHFVVPFVIPAMLWVRNRERFRAWRRRFFTVVGLGLVTYVLLPTVPPWMASKNGEIGPVARVANRGWRRLGVHFADRVFEFGQRTVNVVAALPSLHAAFAGLAAAFFWAQTPRWARPLLALYPAMMAFTLIEGGEHYVFDILLAWLYVAASMLWWQRREARQPLVG